MRNSFLFLALAALIAGCGSPDATSPDASPPDATPPTNEERLAESLSVWQAIKAADDGRYQYTRYTSSFFGYRSTTTFVVEADVVVRRIFEAYQDDMLVDSFDEQGAEVGSNEGAQPVYNIDELYEICRTEVLPQDTDDNILYFTFRDDGVLELCNYVPIDCADGCNEGVEIDSLDMSL